MEAGFAHHALTFPDCTTPPDEVVDLFLRTHTHNTLVCMRATRASVWFFSRHAPDEVVDACLGMHAQTVTQTQTQNDVDTH